MKRLIFGIIFILVLINSVSAIDSNYSIILEYEDSNDLNWKIDSTNDYYTNTSPSVYTSSAGTNYARQNPNYDTAFILDSLNTITAQQKNSDSQLTTNNYIAQTITLTSLNDYQFGNVSLRIWRSGAITNAKVYITGTNSTNDPDFSKKYYSSDPTDVSGITENSAGEWFNFTLINRGPSTEFQTRLVTPTDNLTFLDSTAQIFNSSLDIFNGNITNATISIWFKNGTLANSTTNFVTGEDTINYTTWNISLIYGDYVWNVEGCYNNATGNGVCSIASANRSFMHGYKINEESYFPQVVEGNVETFTLNISGPSDNRLSTAYLYWNNTIYEASVNEDNNEYLISKSFQIPDVLANSNINFNWILNFENNYQSNTSINTQAVQILGFDDCSTYTNRIFNITMYDEDTQAFLNGPNENTSIKISLSLTASDTGLPILNYSNSSSYINPLGICSQSPINNSLYYLEGIIEYQSKDRFQEYYHFQNYSITNLTSNTLIGLYNLNSSKGQEFKLTFKDSNFVPVEGAIIQIQRRYIEEGVYKTIEVPKTGAEGYTIAHLVPNEVTYNLIILKDGIIQASFNEVVANCQNPALQDCEINLNSYGSSVLPNSFKQNDDITFTLTFNKTSRIVKSVYTIISGTAQTVSLNVTLYDQLGNNTICSDQLISAGGQLSCTVPASFGNTTIIAELSKNGLVVGRGLINMAEDPSETYGQNIIILALLIMIVILGFGAVSGSPMIMGVIIIMGLIMLIGLNIVYTPSYFGAGATILWMIIAIALILIKGSNR